MREAMLEADDVLPDEVLARHFGLDTGTEEDPEPAAEPVEPAFDSEDTLDDEALEDEDADTEADEAGDYEPDNELGDEDDEGEDDEEDEEIEDRPSDEPDPDNDFLPPDFDRKEIEKHPELKKAYKHMQAAFTRARQRDAEAAREAQRRLEVLQAQVQSFQAQLADDAGAEEFLVKVALARPEVFERAYEHALKLAEDEGARNLFTREQRLKAAERAAEAERLAMQQERIARRAQEVTALLTKLGNEAGFEGPEDFELAERFVVERIQQNRLATGTADISDEEVKAAVAEVQRLLKRKSKKVERKVATRLARERDEQVKAKVRNARRPAPPKASKSPGMKPRKLPEPPPGVDPVDFTIDALLGLE